MRGEGLKPHRYNAVDTGWVEYSRSGPNAWWRVALLRFNISLGLRTPLTDLYLQLRLEGVCTKEE